MNYNKAMPNIDKTPRFSILILNWRSEQHLPGCLKALQAQSFKDFEILLLDNGGDESIPKTLIDEYPELQLSLTRSEKNLGFAQGNNLIAKQARGEYLVLLNADAFLEPNWLSIIQDATLAYPEHFFASRLLKANEPEKIDGEWHVYHVSGLAWRHMHNQPQSQATNESKEVFGACAAAAVYPRVAFEAVGGFDEDFFAYMEDIDLDFRLQLAGYPCLYLPEAIAYHVGSASSAPRSDFAVFHGHRNLPWVFIKNMPGLLFWCLAPLHVMVNLAYLIMAPFMGKGKVMAKAKWASLKGLGNAFKKRWRIQKNRKASVGDIAKLLNWNPFAPLIKRKF